MEIELPKSPAPSCGGAGFFVRVEKHLGVAGAVEFQIDGSPPAVDFENHLDTLKRAALFFDADAICVA